jgi:hypothetical protein
MKKICTVISETVLLFVLVNYMRYLQDPGHIFATSMIFTALLRTKKSIKITLATDGLE